MPRRPGLFETLLRAGSAGAGIASNMAYPMYQQRMGQQRYEDEQARSERDFAANQDYRQQTLNEQRDWRNQQTGSRNMEAYYGMMGDYMKANKPVDPYTPNTINEGFATALWNNDTERTARMRPYWSEQNAVEDRPVAERQPKMPPNILSESRSELMRRQAQNPDNYNAAGKYFSEDERLPSRETFFNDEVAPMIPSYQRSDPQAFGPNAPDSLYQGFMGRPRATAPQGFGGITTQTTMPGVRPMPQGWKGTPDQWMDYLKRKGEIQ